METPTDGLTAVRSPKPLRGTLVYLGTGEDARLVDFTTGDADAGQALAHAARVLESKALRMARLDAARRHARDALAACRVMDDDAGFLHCEDERDEEAVLDRVTRELAAALGGHDAFVQASWFARGMGITGSNALYEGFRDAWGPAVTVTDGHRAAAAAEIETSLLSRSRTLAAAAAKARDDLAAPGGPRP